MRRLARLAPVAHAARVTRRAAAGAVAAAVTLGVLAAGTAATAPAAYAATELVVATFNVCKVSCAAPAPSWDIRRDRVARVIAASGADIIGLQEATNNPTSHARTQVEDIKNLISPAGYIPVAIEEADNACRRPRDPNGQLAGPSPCENTAMLVYRAGAVNPVSVPTGSNSGRIMASAITPNLAAGSASRSVEWAYLAPAGGKPLLVVVMHTDSEKTPEAEASRTAIAGALAGWVQAHNASRGMTGTPAILLADLNSFAKRQPNGAQKVLTDSGWVDAFTARSKTNIRYSTINYNPRVPDGAGFPANAYEFRPTRKNPLGAATRIDYIMTLGAGITPARYEHVMHLTGKAFNPEYQASDHQMVKAALTIA